MKIVAISPISWDREKSGGKNDRLRSSLVDHLPFDFDSRRRDSRSDGGGIRHRPTPTGIMDEGCAGMFN